MQKSWGEIIEAVNYVLRRKKTLVQETSSPSLWVHNKLGIDLFDNQIEIVESVVDLTVNKLAVLQARGAGKTFAVGIGLTKMCLSHRKLRVGVFAPRADQATRIIDEMMKYGG